MYICIQVPSEVLCILVNHVLFQLSDLKNPTPTLPFPNTLFPKRFCIQQQLAFPATSDNAYLFVSRNESSTLEVSSTTIHDD